MSVKIVFVLLAGLFFLDLIPANSQDTDTLIYIDEVIIRASRLHDYGIGAHVQGLDSNSLQHYRTQSVGEALSTLSSVTVNSYGPGGLATPSVRGGSGSHTTIIWNGLNLQNPMNGQFNLSAMPVMFFEDIQIQYGGAGSLYGSGALTGVFHLGNPDLFKINNEISLGIGTGSFGNINGSAGIKHGNERMASSLKVYGQKVENDFPYRNTALINDPLTTQTNAAMAQWGALLENAIKTGNLSKLHTAAWYQHYDKEIPTRMTSGSPNNSRQIDDHLRVAASWNKKGDWINLNLKEGFLLDKIIFADPDVPDPESFNQSVTWINEAEGEIMFGKNQIVQAAVNYTLDQAQVDSYMEKVARNRVSLLVSYKAEDVLDRLTLAMHSRKELVDGQWIPWVYSGGINAFVSEAITFKGSISKNYKIPTFNDLHWNGGKFARGNPDLVPESGWSTEISLNETLPVTPLSLTLTQNAFHSSIKQWIIWQPGQDGVWRPENIRNGTTQGLEFGYGMKLSPGKLHLSSRGFYQWTNARITNNGENKIMTYLPPHRFMFNFGLDYGRLQLGYLHNFYGKRYYDQKHTLKPYHLGEIQAGYRLPIGGHSIDLKVKVRNLWNVNYQVVAWYAMPRRNYLLSINYSIQTKNKR